MISLKLEHFDTIENLPTPPSQMARMLKEIADTSAMDYNIVKMIQFDPAIASRVLRVANMPLYGYGASIDSLQQAAGLLGPGMIKSLTLTTPILEVCQMKLASGEDELDCTGLWFFSGVTAAIAGSMAAVVQHLESDVCFTAGLIHNIGKVGLAVKYPHVMVEGYRLARDQKILLDDAVSKLYGFTPADVSAELARNWGYPKRMIKILHNQSGFACAPDAGPIAAVVCLARYLARYWGYEDGLETVPPIFPDPAMELLNLTDKDLEKSEASLKERVEEIITDFER